MFRNNDPYTYSVAGTLTIGSDSVAIGEFYASYQATHYDEVQLQSGTAQKGVAKESKRRYVVTCMRRIKVYNKDGLNISPQTDVSSYNDYPALLNSPVRILSQSGVAVRLLSYDPVTVNSQVQTSGTTGSSTGQASSSTTSNTVGSSTSQTNAYSVAVGTFGAKPTTSVTVDNSTTNTQEQSSTSGFENSRSSNQESSASDSMSVKDWGAYCLANPANNSPSWTFGQEYPWSAIECRRTNNTPNPANSNQVQLIVPSTMLVRLYDGICLYPPSTLSIYGVNFVMMAQWLVTISDSASDEVTLENVVNYFSASHSISSGATTAKVYIDKAPSVLKVSPDSTFSTTLDLGVLALAPLARHGSPAIVGFMPGKFVVAPEPAVTGKQPVKFRAFSTANTLRATDETAYPPSCTPGAGFSVSETALSASMTGNCTSLTLSLLFKVVDVSSNYTLYLKHWKVGSAGVMLTFKINDGITIVKYVDSEEAEGGENNMMAIVLRNLDFTSVDCHDYLTLGLNSIDITIAPIGGTTSVYQVRAVSIEAS